MTPAFSGRRFFSRRIPGRQDSCFGGVVWCGVVSMWVGGWAGGLVRLVFRRFPWRHDSCWL
jgi:hypothetical protein